MQAIILAAGAGRRLAPLTNHKPKCFLEIGGKKIIDYQIQLLETSGIREIVVVTGYQNRILENYFRDRRNVITVFNPLYHKTNVITSFYKGMPLLTEPFLYLHADTIFDLPIFDALLKAKGEIVLPVDTKPCSEEAMKVSVDSKKQVTAISKDLPVTSTLGEFIGVAKISENVLPLLKTTVRNIINKGQINAYFEEALQQIAGIDKKFIKIVDISGMYWEEIDFPSDFENAIKNFAKSALAKL